ncbi:MAG: cytochrome c [Acidobacteriaceae bacterium]
MRFLQSALVGAAIVCMGLSLAATLPLSTVAANSNAKRRGAELFAQRGCAHCHGPNGIGGKRGPDLQLVRKRMNKAKMKLQIEEGGMMMPAFGATLTTPQVEDLIAYLRAKRKIIVPTFQPRTDAMNAVATHPNTN